MTTVVVQGTVNAPTGPDSSPSVYSYDNGGFLVLLSLISAALRSP
jgi:hypothetical protein